MKITILTFSLLLGMFLLYRFVFAKNSVNTVKGKSFYDLKITSLDGKEQIDFSAFKGKKVLCVNTASHCGYTPQYEGLQKLYETYKDKLIVIGFPCNQFMFQENGSAEEIESFCKKNYGVTFSLTEKIDVKGNDQHPVYQWLCQKENNGVEDITVKWNFGKFLIDENGKFVAYFDSKTEPLAKELVSKL
ncbi:MAG: glutathione peroxidase [Bacteroidota bacterium]